MEIITSEAQWIDKLTLISQEFELESMNRQHAAELAIESSGTEDNDSDSDYNDSDDDNPENINDDENEEPQLSLEERRMMQMRPLFAIQPKFETVCNQRKNWLLWSNFTIYRSYMPGLDNPIDALQKQEDDFKYVLHLCRNTLTELKLNEYPASKILQTIDATLPNLKKLSLSLKEVVSEDCENLFSNMPCLEELEIEWNCGDLTLPMTLAKSLEQVRGTLKKLEIVYGINDYDPCLPDSFVSVFPRLTVLEELIMHGSVPLNQALFQSVAEIQNLVFLQLRTHCKKDLQCNMYPIGYFKSLKILDICTDFGVTNEFLINLSDNAKNLTELTLVGTNIRDNGIMALNNLTELEKFDLGLYELQKKNTFITDESFEYLFTKKLKELDISNCIKITNHSVITIVKNLTNLRELSVKNTNVTSNVAEELTHLTKYRRKFLSLFVPFKTCHYTFELFKLNKVFFTTQEDDFPIDTY